MRRGFTRINADFLSFVFEYEMSELEFVHFDPRSSA
jgi:hypothetical protein